MSIRLVLTVAIAKGWKLIQIDISNAFLHGSVEERIVISQPMGFVDKVYPNHVCLLNKALYGLKQAPRMWFKRLKEALVQLGFSQGWLDPSLFILTSSSPTVYTIYLFVYVDDMVITGSDNAQVEGVIARLKQQFALRRLGDLSYFLGIQVKTLSDRLYLNQTQYLVNLLRSCNLDNLRPSTTPMVTNLDLHSEEEPIEQAKEYRRVIRSLQYLTLMRPDIQYSVNKLSQYMSSPKPLHWTTLKKILRYLSGTQEWGITLNKVSNFTISGYCDAD